MAVTCSGTVRDPSGAAIANLRIVIRAIGTNTNSLDGAEIVVTTGSDGTYSFTIENGLYGAYLDFGQEHFLGEFFIDDNTADASLNTYLLNVDLGSAAIAAGVQFQGYVNDATAQAVRAEAAADDAETRGAAQVTLATQQVALATQQADRAQTEANRAEVAADNNNNIVMSEAQARAIQAQNQDKFAASGFAHFGKNQTETATIQNINEGMHTNTSRANTLALGRGIDSQAGSSKTDFPILNVAGSVFELNMGLDSGFDATQLLFPPAEQGFHIFDSTGAARGVANTPSLNLRTQNDPKYGNTATTDNEAVARAFEGVMPNGDFRLGDHGNWVSGNDASISYGDDGLTLTTTSNANGQASSGSVSNETSSIIIEVVVGETTATNNRVVYRNSSNAFTNLSLNEGYNRFTVSDALIGTSLLLQCGQTNRSTIFAFVSVKDATEEVVTERKDFAMVEYYEEIVTDDEIFPVCIQNQSTTFGDTDVPTVVSSRPLTYFQQYEGQTGVVAGRCVMWSTLSLENKRKVAEYLGATFFVNTAGQLVNGRARIRTFAGPGNGNWQRIDSTVASGGQDKFMQFGINSANNHISPQGQINSVPALHTFAVGVADFVAAEELDGVLNAPERGTFMTEATATDVAYQGRCFALVLCEVTRLNQRAYHPSLNALGTATFWIDTGAVDSSLLWHEANAKQPMTQGQCFLAGATNTVGNAAPFIFSPDGSISRGSTFTGRPDGKFYDAIYASGQGGVTDHRLSAWDLSSPQEIAKVDAKIKNGAFRGEERLVRTRIVRSTSDASPGGTGLEFPDTSDFTVGEFIYVQNFTGGYDRRQITNVQSAFIDTVGGIFNSVGRSANAYVVHEEATDISIESDFLVQEVMGDPDDVRQVSQLSQGWIGYWNPTFAVGSYIAKLSRKNLDTANPVVQFTTDNGSSWTSRTLSFNSERNELTIDTTAGVANSVIIHSYTAKAYVTEVDENRPVFGDYSGIGYLWASTQPTPSWSLFAESLIQKVNTSGQGQRINKFNLMGFSLDVTGQLASGTNITFGPVMHPTLTLAAPTNNSQAVKAVNYPVAINGALHINYAYEELIYNTTAANWGDNGVMDIQDGQTTNTDTNGTTVLVGTNRSKQFGWTKNQARAGEQVEGVDL